MSAPDTKLETQQRRHRGPIRGIVFSLVFVALVAFIAFLFGGFPLDEQAAPDRAPIGTDGGAEPSGSIEDAADPVMEETR